MIEVPMDIYMKTLDGYINDEDKLVTYKLFSKELEIHVNIAKQILEEYWNKHKNSGIVATILLIGSLKNGDMRVELVKESDLADVTKKYSKIISQHFYSLQKTLLNIELLAGAGAGDTQYGAIQCEKSVQFSDEELFAKRWGAATMFQAPQEVRKPPVDRTTDAKKNNGIGKFMKESWNYKKLAEETTKDKPTKESDEKKISPPRNKVSPKKGANTKKNVQSTKTGFSNLFGRVSAANQKKSPTPINDTKDVVIEKNGESMRGNSINKNSSVDKPAPTEGSESILDGKSLKKETLKDESKRIEEPSTSVEIKTATDKMPILKPTKSKKTKRGRKRERSEESKLDAKRRKRIVVASDSSEEISESEGELIYDSPPREEIVELPKTQSPPPIQNVNGKRKIRKMVDKTFVDEDGYLVTKKEQVYMSCSEGEEEPVKIEGPKITTTETLTKITKKQTTLTSFFKKT